MAVSLSAVALFGVITFFLLRGRSVGIGAALVLFLFGFFAAGTGAYDVIHGICQAIVGAFNNITA